MSSLMQDFRYALRSLAKTPGFLVFAVLTLAVGIAFTTSMFTLIDAVLLRSLRVERPDRLVNIYTSQYDEAYQTSSYPDYLDLRSRNSVMSDVLAFSPSIAAIRIGEQSRLALSEVVTGNYFHLLGLKPAIGRLLSPSDDRPGAARAVIISEATWVRAFGSDPSVVGRAVRIHAQPYTIVGVAPAAFRGLFPIIQPELWIPMTWSRDVEPAGISNSVPSPGSTRLEQRGQRWLFLVGRLKERETVERASANITTIASQLSREYPQSNRDRRLSVVRASDARILPQADRGLRQMALVLMGGMGLVLLIACANVTSMLLARGVNRQREFGLQLALGCSRPRVARQLLVEGGLVACLGAAAGIALAWAVLRSIAAIRIPLPIPLAIDLRLDLRVVAFGIAISMLAGLVAVAVPAFRASRTSPLDQMKPQTLAGAAAGRRRSLRDALVVAQVAATFILLVVAGLHLRSLSAAHDVALGFRPDGVAAVTFDARIIGYNEARSREFSQRAIERVRAIPGVTTAAFTRRTPLALTFTENTILVEGHDRSGDSGLAVGTTVVSPEYFETLGIPIIAGRNFTSADTPQSPTVAIINETMARRYWPNQRAIGRRFHVRTWDSRPIEVVGVSADYKDRFVTERPAPYIHYAWSQRADAPVIIARRAGDADQLAADMQREIRQLDADIVFVETPTLEKQVAVSLLPLKLISSTATAVGGASIFLAAIGLYGLLAYSVARRTREIGIRAALGAERSEIVNVVLRQGMTLVLLAIVLAVPVAFIAARVLSGAIFGVRPSDPLAWTGAVAVVLVSGLIAHAVPARRAARVDPLVALRYE
jgi:predicted permease